jgi:hypothetical protein
MTRRPECPPDTGRTHRQVAQRGTPEEALEVMGGQPIGTSRPDNDPTTQLEKLAGLLEKGLITRREFDEKKRKLLDQI